MRFGKSILPLALLGGCLATDARSAWHPDGNRVSLSGGSVDQVRAVSNGRGGVFIAWTVYPEWPSAGTIQAYLQSLDADGDVVAGWPAAGIRVFGWGPGGGHVGLVADGVGGAYVSWKAQGSLIYLQRIGADGVRAAGWPSDGLRVGNSSAVLPVNLAADATGGVFVGWVHWMLAETHRQRVIRVLGNATVAAGWPAEGIDLAATPGRIPPALAPDGVGGALVAWSETRPEGDRSKLRIHHLGPGGQFDPAWPAGGTVLSERVGYYQNLTLVPDRGGAFAAWDGGPYACPLLATCPECYCPSDQLVSHVDAQGNGAGWPIEGRRLGDSGKTSATPDGGLVALTIRQAKAADLVDAPPRVGDPYFPAAFVTRLEADGSVSPGWTDRGIVSTEARIPTTGDVISDGHGGAFATWIDQRTGRPVIYGTRLASNGTIASGWPEFGSLVAQAAFYPNAPVLVASGGEAIVVWLDIRSHTYQVWADRLTAGPPGSPAPLAVVPAGFAGFGIRRVWPNPSREGFEVTLELPEAAPATLEIYDLAGRVVGTQSFRFPGAARGTVRLNRDDVLEPGVYWLRLRQGPRLMSKRIIAIR